MKHTRYHWVLDIGLENDAALWLLGAKLRQPLHQWDDVPAAKAKDLCVLRDQEVYP